MPETVPDQVRVRTALLSVSDKAGLVDLARALADLGVRLISTGGTARALAEAGLEAVPIERVTGLPEMMDGRVKTLHPGVHGGLLALRDRHAADLDRHGIAPIDLVCINLYPFESAIARPGATERDAIENIDIGGPAMIRSASKNFDWVVPVTDPSQYPRVIAALRAGGGSTTRELRAALALEAFRATACYDGMIASHFAGAIAPAGADPEAMLPARISIPLRRARTLSYGENPHQHGAAYIDPAAPRDEPSVLRADQHHGKGLSYNNLNDAAAALTLAFALGRSSAGAFGAAVVKHTNPCGAAVAPGVSAAVRGAMRGDPLAAYGGILACSGPIDAAAAEILAAPENFLEVVVAPSFEAGAVERLASRWKNIRLLSVGKASGAAAGVVVRPIPGGALAQTPDTLSDPGAWVHAAGPAPGAPALAAAQVLECVARALSSNAVAIGGHDADEIGTIRLYGAGAGQMDRVASCRIAIEKAGTRARGAVVFSDAFFPFPDGPRLLIEAGVGTIVHPGGSKRDADTFTLCAEHGVTCLTTGVRHFRH